MPYEDALPAPTVSMQRRPAQQVASCAGSAQQASQKAKDTKQLLLHMLYRPLPRVIGNLQDLAQGLLTSNTSCTAAQALTPTSKRQWRVLSLVCSKSLHLLLQATRTRQLLHHRLCCNLHQAFNLLQRSLSSSTSSP
jgi:hypothetical protein